MKRLSMAHILKKEKLADKIWRYRLDAPRIAKKRLAGQFIILRPNETSERIPLTIAHGNAAEGWIEIIFQVVGRTTLILEMLNTGDAVLDLVGPLGKPTHIENFGRCVCIGGGVGLAPLYPIVSALREAGNHITSIIGARNKDLLILEKDFQEISNKLCIATDDGTKGIPGFVSTVLQGLVDGGEKFDAAFVIGPAMMMKVTSQIPVRIGIPTWVSLNPIMIDGTGMCGGCRVTVAGNTKFACVDGPEFEASQIDWDEMTKRLNGYREFEDEARKRHTCNLEGGEI